MKLAVVGSRNFTDYSKLEYWLNLIKKDFAITTVISGGAKGADSMAEQWANKNNIPTQIFKPDWSIGRHAGLLRNEDIISNADFIIAFWDGQSTGTKHSIDLANKQNKFCIIMNI